MSKQSELEHILKLYESILTNSHLDEASSSSSDLFDGKSVKIPADGAHGGQSGWQSSNAWDIMAPVGTPVYALADGVAQTFSDYGRNVVKTQGKKLYGQSFTVKSDNGLPSIYYTHLEGSPVTKGSKIQCGQLIGYIMDFPNSTADHVHIGVETGNIRQFLNDDGSIKCAKGQKLSGYEVDSPKSSGEEGTSSGEQVQTSKTRKSNLDIDMGKYGTIIPDFANKAVGMLKANLGLTEQYSEEILESLELILNNKSVVNETALISPLDKTVAGSGFGPRWGKFHQGVDLAANAAEVKAPADGVVVKTAADEYPCGGTIVIDHPGGFRTVFCHLQKINVSQGQKVKQGEIIAISGGGSGDAGQGKSDGRHLHFTLRKNGQLVNPMDYIDKSGVVMTGELPQSTSNSSSDTTDNSTSGTTIIKKSNLDIDMGKYGNTIPDFATKALGQLTAGLGLKEQSSKGKEKFFLQFCNVTQKQVKNGEQVSSGSLLGKTDEDVKVSKMDSLGNRVKLKKGDLVLGKDTKEYLGVITIPKDSNSKIKSPVSGVIIEKFNSSCKNQILIEYYVGQDIVKTERGKQKDPTFTDPLLGAILTAPLAAFKDQYDDSGQLKQKRFGYAGERVDPWVKDLIVKPFKSIGNLYRKENTEEEERKKKKVNENIEKIKKLMK
jgi:murein DD-endopeptidase MepM/ murein hydrolase activator NlpD